MKWILVAGVPVANFDRKMYARFRKKGERKGSLRMVPTGRSVGICTQGMDAAGECTQD